jgi:hypothetical protein
MHHYVVIATNRDNRLIVLADSDGHHHVAQCTGDFPDTDFQLSGALPSVGFAVLIGLRGDAYRLIFSLINCSREWALRLVLADRAVRVPCPRTPSTPSANAGAR